MGQLRAQLNELKQIRKYLKIKRPVMMQKPPRKKNMQFGSSIFKNNPGVGVCFCNSKKNKTARRLHLKVEMLERRRERKFERMIRKERRRKLMEKKKSMKMKKNGHCKTDVKMNCFSHDNNHWKSAPAWTEGPFCACTNSNNNTYWCVRNINVTHNYLYCEYVTGMITYFDLKVDPFQLRNLLYTLPSSDLNYMHGQVKSLREYSAAKTFLNRLSVAKHHKVAVADGTTNGELRGDLLPIYDLNISPVASSVHAAITDDFTSTAIVEAPAKSSRRKSLRRRSQRLE